MTEVLMDNLSVHDRKEKKNMLQIIEENKLTY